jgi:hypothetical protein
MSNIVAVCIAVVAGLVGGVVNAWLVHSCFIMPRCNKDENGRIVSIDPGCIGNIGLGASAGILAFCFTTDVEFKRIIGTSLLFGIGGGNIIVSLLQRHNLLKSEEDALFLKSQIKKLLVLEGTCRQKRKQRMDAAGVSADRLSQLPKK